MIPTFRPRHLAAAAALALPIAAQAQDRSAFLLPVPAASAEPGIQYGTARPGMTSSSPLAFGPGLGDLFIGGGYQLRTRYSDSDDVSLTVGFGLGNQVESLGLEVAITSTSTFSAGAADRISLSGKVSRVVWRGIAVAAGVEGLMNTAGESPDARRSIYGAVSKVFDLNIGGVPSGYLSAVTLNVGAGDGRFCAEQTINFIPAGETDCSMSIFASAGLRATEWLGIVADWTGQDLALAASIAPFRRFPVVIAPGLADVTGTAGDGVRFTLGFGMSVKY